MNNLLYFPVVLVLLLIAGCIFAGYLRLASLDREHLTESQGKVYQAIAKDGSTNVLVIWDNQNTETMDGYYLDVHESEHRDLLMPEHPQAPVKTALQL